jgi:hypothetical protein
MLHHFVFTSVTKMRHHFVFTTRPQNASPLVFSMRHQNAAPLVFTSVTTLRLAADGVRKGCAVPSGPETI